ncbi:MAG: protein kinase, partial [Acidobacteria bacterium]|nr:protein kinase [Acidobacteriota bacterium]
MREVTPLVEHRFVIGTKLLDRYEILRELGRGGMGIVYLARDPILERDVAIKVLTASLLTDEKEERFRREARIVARLEHPGIVPVHDIGQHDRSLFFIMPLVPGESLRAELAKGTLKLGDIVEVGLQTALALDAAHAQGVVHRDVKPENLLVARRKPEGLWIRVTDFGLATASTENRLTNAGDIVGTIAYMSPEQVTSEPIDARTDIYSLGVVLFECLTGEPPFSGDFAAVCYRIAHEAPPTPRSLGASLNPELESIIMDCLHKDPARRHATAGALADALKRYQSHMAESERDKSLAHEPPTPGRERAQRLPLVDRENELAELQRRLNTAMINDAQLVLVSGETGVGKTRLLEELETLARFRKVPFFSGRLADQDRSFPYQGFCDLIQAFFRALPPTSSGTTKQSDFADLAEDLVTLFPQLTEIEDFRSALSKSSGANLPVAVAMAEGAPPPRRELDRNRIFELLARALVRIGRGRPVILAFEDLHLADASLEALQYAVRRMGPTPTLFVGTYRSEEVDKRHPLLALVEGFEGDRRFSKLLLKPLGQDDHKRLVESLLGTQKIEDELLARLFAATEGNPYFTRELVRTLVDSSGIRQDSSGRHALVRTAGLGSDALPATIQQAVERRLERLPARPREVLSLASVLGRTFSYADLAFLAGEDGLEDLVDGLLESGFLEEERLSRGDRLSFPSGVLREVIYAALPRRRRRSLNLKYAEELERRHAGRLDRVYPQLVHHFGEADAEEKVVGYGLALAKKSLDSFSAEEAIRVARTVLDFLEGDGREGAAKTLEVRLVLGRAHRMAGNTASALREIELATEAQIDSGDEEGLFETLLLGAETAWDALRAEEARKWIDRALTRRRETAQPGVLARLFSLGATLANLRGDFERARAYLDQASLHAPPGEGHDHDLPRGGTLTVALATTPHSLDPARVRLDEDVEVIANVCETLAAIDSRGHLTGRLASRWEALENGRVFVFSLAPGVLFHDGRPLSAAAVKSSFERAARAAADILPAGLAALTGTQAFLRGETDEIIGIEVLDDGRLRLTLDEPLPIYPILLTHPETMVLREGVDPKGRPALHGTGPFVVAEANESWVVLARNPLRKSDEPPRLSQLVFRLGMRPEEVVAALRAGEVDVAGNLPPESLEELSRDRAFRTSLTECPRRNSYFVLLNDRYLGKRKGLARVLLGLPRPHDIVRRSLGQGVEPATSFFPPGILGHDPGRRRPRLAAEEVARQLEGETLPVTLTAAVHPLFLGRYRAFLDALLATWAEAGIHVVVGTTTMPSFLERRFEMDLMIGRWNADYDDPDNFTFTLFDSSAGIFRGFHSSPELDALILDARSEGRPEARERLYQKIESHLDERAVLLPLFHDTDVRAVHPRVRGLTLRSTAPFVNFETLGVAPHESLAGARQAEGSGVVSVPIAGDVADIDPARVFLVWQSEVLPNVFETLTRETDGARIVPWLASEFEALDGGRKFRFRLRDGVRFHNGRLMTVRDVRWTFERLLRTRDSQNRWVLFPVKGAQRFIQDPTVGLEGFRILGTHEFVLELEEPVSFFPAFLTFAPSAILPEGVEDVFGSYREGAAGTGPFRVTRFEPARRLELEAFPDYWRPGYPRAE